MAIAAFHHLIASQSHAASPERRRLPSTVHANGVCLGQAPLRILSSRFAWVTIRFVPATGSTSKSTIRSATRF